MAAVKGERGVKSIKNLIKTAFEPVGKAMYIYGGGWNEADSGAGKEAKTLGVCKSLADFAAKQSKSYKHTDYDFKKDISVIHKGFDCSGYIGWVLYNVFNDGKDYVTASYKMGHMLASLGFGSIVSKENVSSHRAGDLMFSSCCRHIYISLGDCSDGSVLLLHSSPPGVQLSGTFAPSGNKNSLAVSLAKEYMQKYFIDWFDRFPENSRNTSYLSRYDKFKWSVLSDAEGYRNISPRQILEDVFNSKSKICLTKNNAAYNSI